jgi:hypothetical protein
MNVLSAARANHLINPVLNNEQLTCVEDHAYVRVWEIILLVSTSSPGYLREFARLHITQEESAASRGHQIPVLVHVNLRDLMALGWFQHDALAVLDSLNDHLGEGDVGEFELALVFLFFEANVENINWTAKGTDANLGTVWFPSEWGDWVVVLNLFAADLIPLRSLGIEVVNIETVKVSDNGGLSSGVESGTSEFLHTLVLGVVESLETISGLLIEVDLSIITSSQDVRAPGESVGDGGMLNLRLGLSVKVESQNWAVKVTRADPLTVRRRGKRHNERIATVNGLTLIW